MKRREMISWGIMIILFGIILWIVCEVVLKGKSGPEEDAMESKTHRTAQIKIDFRETLF